jgi:phage tail-like protein
MANDPHAERSSASYKRGYVAGNFGLELDGMAAGWLASFEGGMPNADVILEKLGPDHYQHKHISPPKYDDITLTFGTAMSQHFWKWVKSSFDELSYVRKNGAVVAANYNYKETSRLTFYNGLITELTFPALDATSREGARVTCKVTPEYTRMAVTPKGGSDVKFQGERGKQMKWSPANFRLSIDGLEEGCTRVAKIDAITLRKKSTPYQVGEERDYSIEPVQVEYPNLAITLPESHSEGFFKWYEDFVIAGNNGEDGEKTGSLDFLDQSLGGTLFTVSFDRLGIFKITPDKAEAGSEQIRRIKVEMYMEHAKIEYGAGATFA